MTERGTPRWPDDIEGRRCAKCHSLLVPVDMGVFYCETCGEKPGFFYMGASRDKPKLKIEIVEID